VMENYGIILVCPKTFHCEVAPDCHGGQRFRKNWTITMRKTKDSIIGTHKRIKNKLCSSNEISDSEK
jgi:hypothetical protein